MTGTVIEDEAGRPVATIAVARDFTERMRVEQELLRYQEHLATLHDVAIQLASLEHLAAIVGRGVLGRVLAGASVFTDDLGAEPGLAGVPDWHPKQGPVMAVPVRHGESRGAVGAGAGGRRGGHRGGARLACATAGGVAPRGGARAGARGSRGVAGAGEPSPAGSAGAGHSWRRFQRGRVGDGRGGEAAGAGRRGPAVVLVRGTTPGIGRRLGASGLGAWPHEPRRTVKRAQGPR
jgi:hypothetical protein